MKPVSVAPSGFARLTDYELEHRWFDAFRRLERLDLGDWPGDWMQLFVEVRGLRPSRRAGGASALPNHEERNDHPPVARIAQSSCGSVSRGAVI
jgi:hypothetical protein